MARERRAGDRGRGISWRSKLLILLTLFSVLPLATLAYWVLIELEDSHRNSMLSSLEGLANAKAAALEQLTDNRKRDVERIAGLLVHEVQAAVVAQAALDTPEPEPLPELHDAEALATPEEHPVEQDAGTPDGGGAVAEEPDPVPVRARNRRAEQEAALADAIAHLRQTLGLILWDQAEFEELLVIRDDGRVIASTFAEHEGRTAATLDYFQAGRRATFVQPVFRSPVTSRLTMVIATPIRDESAQEIAVLAARLNLERVFSLINDTTGLGQTGETLVAKVIQEKLVFMAPTRHDADAALHDVEIDDHTSDPLGQAALGHAGRGETIDYRHRRVLAAWKPVGGLDWGLVVKIDDEEAMRAANEVRTRTLQISVAILLLAVLASIFAARELVRPLRQLKDATDRISRGDLGVALAIRSADEIGDLADSFERMVAAIKFFREHARPPEEDVIDEEDEVPPNPEDIGTA